MVRKDPYAPKKTAGRRLSYEESCWVKYQLNLRNIAYRTVAHETGLNPSSIASFLNGCNNSPKIRAALCKLLGYAAWDDLRAAANGKGGMNE